MRLICGFVLLNGSLPDTKVLDSMITALTPAGLVPSVSCWIEGPAALAMLDFGVSADKTGLHLPQLQEGFVLAADVCLHEPQELSRSLGLDQVYNDEALTLSALARWGDEAPERLLGDFALACWNPETRSLLCARDIVGVRPFCYTHKAGEIFAFSSFPNALVEAGLAHGDLNDAFIARQAINSAIPLEQSPFHAIAKLPPASLLQISPDQPLTIRPYWRLDFAKAGTWQGSPVGAATGLRTRLIEAVRCRLSVAGQVGAHLSGGLDSSAISIIASRLLAEQSRQLYAYSFLGMPIEGEELLDESEYVKDVLVQEPSIVWTPVYLAEPETLSEADINSTILYANGQAEDQICVAAATAGVRRILSGWGGDECATFRGAGSLAEALLRGSWRYLFYELHQRKKNHGRSILHGLAAIIVNDILPESIEKAIRWAMAKPVRPFISDLFPRFIATNLAERLTFETLSLKPDARRNRYALLNNYHITLRLEQSAGIGARYGVAYSFPFLDRRVMEYALSLPSQFFLQNGIDRQPFRDAMAEILPESIRWRTTKFIAFPEALVRLARQKSMLLAQLAFLRQQPSASALFNFDAIEAALCATPEGEEALAYARKANVESYPVHCRLALHIPRLLAIARFICQAEGKKNKCIGINN